MKKKLSQLILILRKLGILRYGVKKYKYTNYRDMPIEALLEPYRLFFYFFQRKESAKVLTPLKGGTELSAGLPFITGVR